MSIQWSRTYIVAFCACTIAYNLGIARANVTNWNKLSHFTSLKTNIMFANKFAITIRANGILVNFTIYLYYELSKILNQSMLQCYCKIARKIRWEFSLMKIVRRDFFLPLFPSVNSLLLHPPKLASRQRDEKWTFSVYQNGGSGVGNCFFFFADAPAENRAHKTNPRFPFRVRFRVSSLPFGVLARGEVYAHKTAPQKISACSETVATQNRSG